MTDDTISRAAALKGLEDLNIASFYELNEHSKETYTEVKAMLKALPSAQTDHIGEVTEMVGDVISRQAMINEINLHVGTLYDNPTLVESLKLLVWSLPSVQGWIPCCEKLPDKEDVYLVTDKTAYGEKISMRYWNIHEKDAFWSGYESDVVTAWMPLPKPYREGGEP